MSDFRPSQVCRSDYRDSILQSSVKEIWAFLYATYLRDHGDKWDQEVDMAEMLKHLEKAEELGLHPVMLQTLKMFPAKLLTAHGTMLFEGYINQRVEKGAAYMSVTEKMIEFYRPYVAA